MIPVIDLFAGPGGLGEGFSSYINNHGSRCFRVVLSIEKEKYAHQTLELRAFYREFQNKVPEDYYDYLKGKITREALFLKFPREASTASKIAWFAELGSSTLSPETVDKRIQESIGSTDKWLLMGGPPCQAYSVIGRSRVRSTNLEKYESDPRHYLYKEYLRIIAEHKPPVFIMENVLGIISTKLNGSVLFHQILNDLQNPLIAFPKIAQKHKNYELKYRLYSFVQNKMPESINPSDFIINMKNYGVPQDRRRVIILGIREDVEEQPQVLEKSNKLIPISRVIEDLPKIRSSLSKDRNSVLAWIRAIRSVENSNWINDLSINTDLRAKLISCAKYIRKNRNTGGEYIAGVTIPKYNSSWYSDPLLDGVCNHSSRSHIIGDIHRYLYAACFALVNKRSPLLRDFPNELLPNHNNAEKAVEGKNGLFSDRFRVQLRSLPSTTITSHIAKDGHYYIHPDPMQCRSLTVREAARLQTFPDNYYFEGPRTSQYLQVGNAVPPLLAYKIAGLINSLFNASTKLK